MTLTFRQAKVIAPRHIKLSKKAIRSKDRVEANGQTDRQTERGTLPTALPSRLMRSVKIRTMSIGVSRIAVIDRSALSIAHDQPVLQNNKAIIDSRLRPDAQLNDEYLLVFIVEQNLVGISAVMPVVFCRRLGICFACRRAIM